MRKGRPSLTGLVLAGGQSARMGRDKALLVAGGEPLLARAARVLGGVCGRVLVAVRAEQAELPEYAGFELVVDDRRDAGPAAGLLAAWRAAPGSALLVLAVDMPLVDAPLLGLLVDARDPALLATAFEHADGTLEPLCAIWEPAADRRLRTRARNSRFSLRKVLESSPIRRVKPPDPACLQSVNTAVDWAALRGRREL